MNVVHKWCLEVIRSFTYYWKNSTWKHERLPVAGSLLQYSSNLFFSRGVAEGDQLYIVTVLQGAMLLAGRIKVNRLHKKKIDGYIGGEIIESIAPPKMSFERCVPMTVVERLRMIGEKPLKFNGSGMLNVQTLRGIRQLTPDSAAFLDDLL
jgi:hypothetical protein